MMKKLLAGVLSIMVVFSSSVFAAYTPTDADQDIKDQVSPMIESIAKIDVNRLVGIANKIAVMLPEFDSDGRTYHILEWVYDTIVIEVDAERARRAEMMDHDHDMDDHTHDEDMDEDMMEDDSEMMSGDDSMDDSDTMSGDDSMDDSGDDMTTTHVIDMTGEPYLFSVEEIVVNAGDTVTVNLTSIAGPHDWVVDEFDAATAVVSPGEDAVSVTFVADTAGTYEYYCSVGDHRANGMIGNLVVQ